jgi:hypothetical protein
MTDMTHLHLGDLTRKLRLERNDDGGLERQGVQLIQLQRDKVSLNAVQANARVRKLGLILNDVGHVVRLVSYRVCGPRHASARSRRIQDGRWGRNSRHSDSSHSERTSHKHSVFSASNARLAYIASPIIQGNNCGGTEIATIV